MRTTSRTAPFASSMQLPLSFGAPPPVRVQLASPGGEVATAPRTCRPKRRIRWTKQRLSEDLEYGIGWVGDGGWELFRLRRVGQRAVWFARKQDPLGDVVVDLGMTYTVRHAKERAQFHEDYAGAAR